jgi:hypothetical protein
LTACVAARVHQAAHVKMSSFFRHSKLVACKFVFDVNIISLVQSPASGRMVFVKWQRGSKRSGSTKRVIISGNTATFNENLEVKATLYKDAKKGKFDPKALDLLVIEPKEKKESKLGVCSVDLALCAVNIGSDSSHILSIKDGELAGALLKVSIRARLRHGADGEGSVGSTMSDVDHSLEHSGKFDTAGSEAASNASEDLNQSQGSDEEPAAEPPSRQLSSRDDVSKKPAAVDKFSRPSAAGALLKASPAADAFPAQVSTTASGVPRVTSAGAAAPLGMLAALKAKQVGMMKAVDDVDTARTRSDSMISRGSQGGQQPSSDEDDAAAVVAPPQPQPTKAALKPSASSDKLTRLSATAAVSKPSADDAPSSRDKSSKDSKSKSNSTEAAAAATQRSVILARQEDAAAVKTTFDARQSSELVNAAYSKASTSSKDAGKMAALRGALEMLDKQESELQLLKKQLLQLSRDSDESNVLEAVVWAVNPTVFQDANGALQMCSTAWVLERCLLHWGYLDDGAASNPAPFHKRMLDCLSAVTERARPDGEIFQYLLSNMVILHNALDGHASTAGEDSSVVVLVERLQAIIEKTMGIWIEFISLKVKSLIEVVLDDVESAVQRGGCDIDNADRTNVCQQVLSILQSCVVSLQKGLMLPALARYGLKSIMQRLDGQLYNAVLTVPGMCSFTAAVQLKHVVSAVNSWGKKAEGPWLFADK